MSPEDDWDTLLSTIAPDPQPPSVGSSFASESASASAAASQSAAASSSTSLSAPDTAGDLGTIVVTDEVPCESGCENSDSEGDDGDEAEHNALRRFRNRSSYANVVARGAPGSNEDSLEHWGGLGGLHRVLRNLATQEDIPDEWWAAVGLTRNLS